MQGQCVHSPNYGVGSYPSGTSCVITIKEHGTIDIQDFTVQHTSASSANGWIANCDDYVTLLQNGTTPVKYCGTYDSRTGATSAAYPNNGYTLGMAPVNPGDQLYFGTDENYQHDGFKICLAADTNGPSPQPTVSSAPSLGAAAKASPPPRFGATRFAQVQQSTPGLGGEDWLRRPSPLRTRSSH